MASSVGTMGPIVCSPSSENIDSRSSKSSMSGSVVESPPVDGVVPSVAASDALVI